MPGEHLQTYKWTSATAPRGTNPGGMSKQERAFRSALQSEFIPEAAKVLREMLAASRDVGNDPASRQRSRMDFMKCCGLIPKATDDAAVEALAAKLLDNMLAEAERRAESRGEAR